MSTRFFGDPEISTSHLYDHRTYNVYGVLLMYVRTVSLLCLVWSCLVMVSGVQAEDLPNRAYKLGPGDVLEISVWDDENLRREVKVRPDGKISFPLIGDVRAYGRSVSELKAVIEDRMDAYVPETPVTVILNSLGYPRVYVMGKVEQPGPFMMDSELNVVQALAMAGGLTTFADKGGILILRGQGEEQKAYHFNYKDLEQGENMEQNIILKPGDTVLVP